MNNLNEISNVTRSGTLTVSGSTTESPSSGTLYQVTSVNVSGTGLGSGWANLYSDGTWAMPGSNLANGANTYTAVAQDTANRQDTSTVSVNLPATDTCIYDLNGNLRTNGTRIFDYDDENQLIRVTEPNAWKSEFTYDGMMRRRITKEFTWSGGAWLETNEVRFVYDGRLVVQERDANNLPVVSYTRGLDLSSSLDGAGGIGGLIARTDHRLLTIGDPNAHAYYHADGNGNITALINTNGLLVASYSYDPFGNMLSMSGPLADANVYRFSSKEFGRNSGLYYYGFRFYDANSQRWVNRDPIAEKGGINVFTFVKNGPLNAFDAEGEGVREWCANALSAAALVARLLSGHPESPPPVPKPPAAERQKTQDDLKKAPKPQTPKNPGGPPDPPEPKTPPEEPPPGEPWWKYPLRLLDVPLMIFPIFEDPDYGTEQPACPMA